GPRRRPHPRRRPGRGAAGAPRPHRGPEPARPGPRPGAERSCRPWWHAAQEVALTCWPSSRFAISWSMGPAGWLPPGVTVAAHPLPAAQQVAAPWPLIQESRAVVLPNVAISTAAPPARSQSMSCCAFESCGAWVTLPQSILDASELAAGPSLPQAVGPAASVDTAAAIGSLIAPSLSGENL